MTSPAREQARRLPTEPGVYRFRDELGRVMYSGRATSLRSRVGSYFGDIRDRPHLIRMVARISRVEALVCASLHEACWLERNLHTRSLPRWNRAAAGQEVPHVHVHIVPRKKGDGAGPIHSMFKIKPKLSPQEMDSLCDRIANNLSR